MPLTDASERDSGVDVASRQLLARFQTGFLATKLLKGGAIKDIPIEDARRSIVAVNRKRMQDLGIRLSPEARSIVDNWID